MSQKQITVLMPDTEGELGIKVLRCLAEASNLKIYCLSREAWNSARLSRHHAGFFSHKVDTFDERRLEVIFDHVRRLKPDVLLPVDQPTIRLLSKHRDAFHGIAALPPLPPLSGMDIAENKWLLTNVMEKEAIPYPRTLHANNRDWSTIDPSKLAYPVLTKPVTGAGGTGIEIFNSAKELEMYLKAYQQSDDLVIQSFIPGIDLGCSVLCENGVIKAYTIQKGVRPGNKRFEPPSVVEFLHSEQIFHNAEKLMRALNWSGVANIDHRYNEETGEASILEINPRFWGSVLASVVAGINFPELMIHAAMGMEIPPQTYQAIRYAKPEQTPKLLARKYFKGDKTIHSISETGLPYTLKDPGPEFIKYVNKFLERFYD